MTSIRMLIATALGLALGAGLAAGAGSAPKPGFLPGTWVGTGVHKGIFDIGDGHPSPTVGKVSFTLAVDKSLKASGTLTIRTTQETSIAKMHGVVVGTGTMKVTGTGSDVRYAGTLHMEGKLTDGKVTIPWKLDRPTSGRLVITQAGCTKVVGRTVQSFPISWSAVPKPGTPKTRCA
jgi:hypothetical protein